MTDGLVCTDIIKTYPGQEVPALGEPDGSGVSVSMGKGEFFALLGPSGCGKTTFLRILGGFLEPERGAVLIDGVDVTTAPPYRRPTNTVFQSYALFPHMRLGANVSFGLQMAGVRRGERAHRAAQALALVGLAGWEERRVSELSGGQQQRAALARALANRPSVLLLDEPLGALDLRLRRQMQEELVTLKAETSTTFVHVTHDQEEACAVADRIAVMNHGRIVQVDTPLALYRAPRTSFVAEFLDVGTVFRGDASSSAGIARLAAPELTLQAAAPEWATATTRLAMVLPHDKVSLKLAGAARQAPPTGVLGIVERVMFTGVGFNVFVRIRTGTEVRVAVSEAALDGIAPGAEVELIWSPDDVIVVEDDTSPGE